MAQRHRKAPYTYFGENLREVAFPLGGIGTGCVSLEGRGALRDWEIYNRPNKGTILPMTFPILWVGEESPPLPTSFPSLRSAGSSTTPSFPTSRDSEAVSAGAKTKEGATHCLVIQGPRMKEFVGDPREFWGYGHGQIRQQGDGLPCFDDVVFKGTFPFARLQFHKEGLPLDVELEAWSPFIPRNSADSQFPVACLTYKLKNKSNRTLRATVAFNLYNAIAQGSPLPQGQKEQSSNAFHQGKSCRGIQYANRRFGEKHSRQGSMALTTDWQDVTYLTHWLRGDWFDSLHDFWDMFSPDGLLEEKHDRGDGDPTSGCLGLKVTLKPGESAELPVLISWCFPNNQRYWGYPGGTADDKKYRWVNPYAKRWPTAWDAAEDFFARRKQLHKATRSFEDAIFKSKLPAEVLESVSATASTLRSPTVLLTEDGSMWAWEGCSPADGCCSGSCTHVWNYALTQAYLFPDLHRSMRKSEYEHSFDKGEQGKKGAIVFRIPLPFNEAPSLWHAASDGQLGGVVQLYRDWRISGDDAYLKHMWPYAKRALEFAWVQWDRDKDGLVEGDQHNTYDINFQGPNPLTQSFYLAALRSGEEIARHLGDTASASTYRKLFDQGSKKAVEAMFNGEYFEQTIDCLAKDAPKYQHGKGCLSDQVFGQLAAHVAGLGYLYDKAVVKKTMKAIFKHNFKSRLGEHANMQRIYAVQDEPGLLLCSWPRGSRPAFPFVYSDEVWTGIEYQVASHMIYEGLMDEGLAIVRGIRKRHDGSRRNPYNEFECGSHYARAMSAWGLLLAYKSQDGAKGASLLSKALMKLTE
ncbi:MAG: hypothetical protein HZC36_11740 [Armatimonadetes bacterium]|nr:hypothetical protein [Armatimonadota bacterium]